MDEATAAFWRKLNLKDQHCVVVVDPHGGLPSSLLTLDAPRSMEAQPTPQTGFFLGFAQTLAEVEAYAGAARTFIQEDPVVWIAHPKGSSRRLTCEFNRDTGWQALGDAGYEPVRQVAIDADWSALRFRKVGQIKSTSRSFAMTDEGKAKAQERTGSRSGPGSR